MKSFVKAHGRHSKSRGKKRGEYIILLPPHPFTTAQLPFMQLK